MPYDVTHKVNFNSAADQVTSSAASLLEKLGGKTSDKRNPAKAQLEVTFNKKIGDRTQVNRVMLRVKVVPEAASGSTVMAKAFPVKTADAPAVQDDVVRGIPAAGGIAIGPLHPYEQATSEVKQEAAADPAEEKELLQAAIAAAGGELETVHTQMLERIGPNEAAIFEAHLEILKDLELFGAAAGNIDQGRNAGQAWPAAGESTAGTLGADPQAVPAVKAQIRGLTRSAAQNLSRQVLECATAAEVRATVARSQSSSSNGQGGNSYE